MRKLTGDAQDPLIDVRCEYLRNGNVELYVASRMDRACKVAVKDNAYGGTGHCFTIAPKSEFRRALDLRRSFHWYHFSLSISDSGSYLRRYAGRVETGRAGFSDPAMGHVNR